jgi:hypothetical protein
MTGKQKTLIAASAVVLVLAAVIVFLAMNLDLIVKRAIEKYGSEATKTSVRVGSVSLRPARGEGTITGLSVANPKGFSSSPIFALGAVSMKIEPRSITGDVIVIDNIRITGTRVLYETNGAGGSNVEALKKNLGAPEGRNRTAVSKERKREKRLRIRRLVVENSSLEVRAGDRPRTLSIGRIELVDIGGPSGATPEQAAKEIVGAIAAQAAKEATQAGAEYLLKKELERALRK